MDEKTTIQALERHQSKGTQSKGGQKRVEFEYMGHGTTTLMAALNVENGLLLHQYIDPTRNEKEFAIFIQKIVDSPPEMDQLFCLQTNSIPIYMPP